MSSVRSTSFKYQRFTQSRCKDIWIRIFDIVAEAQFLSKTCLILETFKIPLRLKKPNQIIAHHYLVFIASARPPAAVAIKQGLFT